MSTLLKINDPIPTFSVADQNDNLITNKDLKKEYTIFYFYPKDDTPGCTIEACDFTNEFEEFQNLNTKVYGVSADSVESHQKFIAKKKLKIDLLADTEKVLCEGFGVWQQKNMMGKKYTGIVRSTFLINSNGKVAYVWEKVKVMGHVKAIKQKIEELQKN